MLCVPPVGGGVAGGAVPSPGPYGYVRLLISDGDVIQAGTAGTDCMLVTNVKLYATAGSSTDLIDGSGIATASHFFLNDTRFAPSFAFDKGGGDNTASWISRRIVANGGYPIHLTYQFPSPATFRKMVVHCNFNAYPGLPITDQLVAPKDFRIQGSVAGFGTDTVDLAAFSGQVSWGVSEDRGFVW